MDPSSSSSRCLLTVNDLSFSLALFITLAFANLSKVTSKVNHHTSSHSILFPLFAFPLYKRCMEFLHPLFALDFIIMRRPPCLHLLGRIVGLLHPERLFRSKSIRFPGNLKDNASSFCGSTHRFLRYRPNGQWLCILP